MKRIYRRTSLYCGLFCLCILGLTGCNSTSAGKKSPYSILHSQFQKGYPSRTGAIDIREGFANPPKGYGNVPFYWWTGDSLRLDRLAEQLDILADASTDGLCISYNHTNQYVDTVLNRDFTGNCGRVQAGAPEVLTDEWWKVWNAFSALCADKGIGVGMDDYVVAWPGNGGFIDEVLAMPGIGDHPGRLMMDTFAPGDSLPDGVITTCSRPNTDSMWVVWAVPSRELSPLLGQQMIERYFNPFLEHMDAHAQKGMNYFFQDELQYGLTLHSWTPDMPQQFMERKGYDIVPLLPLLFVDSLPPALPKGGRKPLPRPLPRREGSCISSDSRGLEVLPTGEDLGGASDLGWASTSVRLDYADVVTALARERYFEPIYHWHADRGLIYGSDNEGRGTQPTRYLDYFQTEQWFTAPGNDAPSRGSSFTQTKVSSSIAHLYNRPRTWLEAFHSMGWDANGALLTHQLDHHLIAGGNLLCMHGLYYSTHGGWWEWAPPCFHFRMPYWPHMKVWLKRAERLCFVLSQGVHVADVAVLYPTETMQAVPGTSVRPTFDVTDVLSPHGCDYDFIDFTSLQRADIVDGTLRVADECYRVLVLADTRALHAATLDKIRQFAAAGGCVIATGTLMDELQQDEHILKVASADAVLDAIRASGTPDFLSGSREGRVLHHRVADQEVYMVMDVPHGDSLFFRAHGKVEIWDAQHGTISEVAALCTNDEGTWVRFDGNDETSALYVFSGKPLPRPLPRREGSCISSDSRGLEVLPMREDLGGSFRLGGGWGEATVSLSGDWDIAIVPTMNNKWGDFRLPARDEIIGVEQREMISTPCASQEVLPLGKDLGWAAEAYPPPFQRKGASKPLISRGLEVLPTGEDLGGAADLGWASGEASPYGYAPYLEMLVCDSTRQLDKVIADKGSKKGEWVPYHFSWQYGVYDSPGSQGWHGLKAKVDDRFLLLDQGGHQLFRTRVLVPATGTFRLVSEGRTPDRILVDGVRQEPGNITLTAGWHTLLVAYASTHKTPYKISDMRSESIDRRERGMVMFYPAAAPEPTPHGPYEPIVASKWYGTDHLIYDPNGGEVSQWLYRFPTAPGTRTMHFDVAGRIDSLWVDGRRVAIDAQGDVHLDTVNPHPAEVLVWGTPLTGYPGSAFFTEPIRMTCEGGRMPAGDWTVQGALKFYSGGIRYSRDVDIAAHLAGRRTVLDLGEVDATCEVSVNGKPVDVLIGKPYTLDVTDYLVAGTNHIEVLVYSTLANHYLTIPSPYKGTPHAGLIGPAQLCFTSD